MSNKLFCILGESASGKDTLVQRLCSELNLTQIISYTTRPRRVNEGETHIFVDDAVYEQMRENGDIAAYTQIGEYRYWSTKDQLRENDIYIIDAIGLQSLEELGIEDLDFCSIYINVPAEVRLSRALNRGDDAQVYTKRMLAELDQFVRLKGYGGFDYAVSNLNGDKAFEVIKKIIEVETVQN